MCVLAVDIGGTGTKMGCAQITEAGLVLRSIEVYASQDHDSLSEIINLYFSHADHTCDQASIAIAGPIKNDSCKLTNLSWTIEKTTLQNNFRFSQIYLLNDLEAQGYAVIHPEFLEVETIKGSAPASGNLAILAPGTGLGEAFVGSFNGIYHPFPSEGGHCDFSPTNSLEMELLEFVKRKHKRVSWERVISGGMGFSNIYEFFVETNKYQWDRELDEAQRQGASYFAKELFRLASRDLLIAKKTIELYSALLGAEAGNLVLKVMATGGLFLSGGVTRHLLPHLSNSPFYERFIDKGRFRDLLSWVPITAVTDKNVGIKGAALRALKYSS